MHRPPQALIDAQGLDFSPDGGRTLPLRGCGLRVDPGESVALVGPSGSGKSILLRLLAALDPPSAGQLRFDGRPYPPPAAAADFRRHEIGLVFEAYRLLPMLTAAENVEVAMLDNGQPRHEHRKRARLLLEEVGLGHRAGHLPAELSGAERQRVGIARALANRPRLLLADEPTGHLDSLDARRIMRLLTDVHAVSGMTLIVATHDAQVGSQMQRIVRMSDGRVIDAGRAAA
ncbi:MAG: ABC transporter ATP-binding protein [Nevskiales bacterium]|nr:ABC transporter ATP-binding protein [Nevskiales bacterium]